MELLGSSSKQKVHLRQKVIINLIKGTNRMPEQIKAAEPLSLLKLDDRNGI